MLDRAVKADQERDIEETKCELIDLYKSQVNELFRPQVQKLAKTLLLDEIDQMGFQFKEAINPPEGYEGYTLDISQRLLAIQTAPEDAKPQLQLELGILMERIWIDKLAAHFHDQAKQELGL